VVTARIDKLQMYWFLCGDILCLKQKWVKCKGKILCLCGFYCGYINSRYSAIVRNCVWKLFYLQQL